MVTDLPLCHIISEISVLLPMDCNFLTHNKIDNDIEGLHYEPVQKFYTDRKDVLKAHCAQLCLVSNNCLYQGLYQFANFSDKIQ
jgi:hypothetical protein